MGNVNHRLPYSQGFLSQRSVRRCAGSTSGEQKKSRPAHSCINKAKRRRCKATTSSADRKPGHTKCIRNSKWPWDGTCLKGGESAPQHATPRHDRNATMPPVDSEVSPPSPQTTENARSPTPIAHRDDTPLLDQSERRRTTASKVRQQVDAAAPASGPTASLRRPPHTHIKKRSCSRQTTRKRRAMSARQRPRDAPPRCTRQHQKRAEPTSMPWPIAG